MKTNKEKIKSKDKNFISAVVYLRNNELKIGDFILEISKVFEENFEHYEIICVNDNSNDKTIENARKAGKEIKGILSIINMSFFHGLEKSMKAGIDLAIGDFVYEFDSVELNIEKSLIIDIYKKSLEGFDIVSASPSSKNLFTSKMFYKFFNKYSDSTYTIGTETFRILSRRAINRVSDLYDTIPYRKAIYSNCGLKKASVSYNSDQINSAILDKNERMKVGLTSLILFTNIVYKISIFIAILMMFISIATLVYSAVIFLIGNPIAGWTTTISLLSLAFFFIFGLMAMIIKYLDVIIDLIFQKRNYMISSTEKVTK